MRASGFGAWSLGVALDLFVLRVEEKWGVTVRTTGSCVIFAVVDESYGRSVVERNGVEVKRKKSSKSICTRRCLMGLERGWNVISITLYERCVRWAEGHCALSSSLHERVMELTLGMVGLMSKDHRPVIER